MIVEESLVERIFGISKVWFIRWTLVTIISVVVCYSVRPYVGYEDGFGFLVNAMNVISFVMTLGLPLFLAAGISYSTTDARNRILVLIESGKNAREVFLRRLVGAYALVLLFSVTITIAMFVEPLVPEITFHSPEGTGYLIYILPVLFATIIFSLLIVTMGVLLAVVTDDIIISTASGSIVSFGLAVAVGGSPQALVQSLTRGLAMLSPSNTVRMVAGLLTGRDGTTLVFSIGFEATPLAVLLSLSLLCVIAFISAISSVRILRRTASFWPIQSEVSTGIWVSETEQRGEHLKSTREMKVRKVALVGLIIFLLSGVLFWTVSYRNVVLVEATISLYQSPEGGDQIRLGDWFVFDCNLQPAQYGLANYLYRECLIDDWGNAPEELTFYYDTLDIHSTEFLLLNETQRQAVSKSRNVTEGWGGYGGSTLIQEDRFYTFVLKVVATENATLDGIIYCSININQRPH